MQLVVYILVYPLLWLISRLPFKVIYFISDGVYVLLYKIIGYRKKVVRNNLALVFPEKSESERLLIEKNPPIMVIEAKNFLMKRDEQVFKVKFTFDTVGYENAE